MNGKRKKRKISRLNPEEWYLIRKTDPELTPQALDLLKETEGYFVDLDDYQAQQGTHPVIAAEFNYKYAHTVLIHCSQDDMVRLTTTSHFQKVWSGPHAGRSCLTLNGKGADQIHLLLRIKENIDINIVRRAPIPTNCTWKQQTVQIGPLTNLEGQVVNDRSNQRKFWFTLLPQLQLLFLIPAIQLHLHKKNELDLPQEPTGKSNWYMVHSKTIDNLEYAFLEERDKQELKVLDPSYFPTEEDEEYTIYYPEFIERSKSGMDTRIPVFPNHYFIHTTAINIETFRYKHPDSHVYVVRDRKYRPLKIKEQDLKTFIKRIEELNGIVNPDQTELLPLLQIGDRIQYKLNLDSTPITGKVKELKKKGQLVIVDSPMGRVSVQQENIQLDEEMKAELGKRRK